MMLINKAIATIYTKLNATAVAAQVVENFLSKTKPILVSACSNNNLNKFNKNSIRNVSSRARVFKKNDDKIYSLDAYCFSPKTAIKQQILECTEKIKQLSSELPPKPKQYCNAYILFVRQKLIDLKKDNPDYKFKEFGPFATEWRNLKDKSKYEQQSLIDSQRYNNLKQEYDKILKEQFTDVVKKIEKTKNQLKALKQLENSDPPEIHSSAYDFFTSKGHTKKEYLKLDCAQLDELEANLEESRKNANDIVNHWISKILVDENISSPAKTLVKKLKKASLAKHQATN